MIMQKRRSAGGRFAEILHVGRLRWPRIPTTEGREDGNAWQAAGPKIQNLEKNWVQPRKIPDDKRAVRYSRKKSEITSKKRVQGHGIQNTEPDDRNNGEKFESGPDRTV